MKLNDLFLSYFSTLLKTVIEEIINTELQLLREIPLDVTLYSKDFTNTIIRDHVESIICSSDYVEVLSIFILIYCRKILHWHYKYTHVFISEGNNQNSWSYH